MHRPHNRSGCLIHPRLCPNRLAILARDDPPLKVVGRRRLLFILRTGSQWGALSATGICSKSSAHRRFTEWVEAGVFHEFWRLGLLAYDGVAGIDWEWLSADGAMTKAPLGGEKNRPQPDRPGQAGDQALGGDRRPRAAPRLRRRGRQRARLQAA